MGDIGAVSGAGITAAANLAQQRIQNDWQTSENIKDRKFQSDQWFRQFEAENDEYRLRESMANEEYDRRFNQQNEYNSPSAVIRRLQQAGINPAAALGQLTGTGGLAAAGGSSSPQFSSPTLPPGIGSHSVTPLMADIPDFGGSIASMMHALSSMKQANVAEGRLDLDSERQNKMIQVEYDNLIADVHNKQVQELLTRIRADIDGTLGKSEKAAAIYRDLAAARLAAEKSNTEEFERKFKAAQTALLETKDNAIQQALPQLLDNLSSLHDVYEADIREKTAFAAEHYAGANLKNEEAATVSALREGQITAQEFANELVWWNSKAAEESFKEQITTQPERIHSIIESARQSDIITATMAADLRSAVARGDYAELREFLGAIGDAVNSYVSVANAGSKRLDALNGAERNQISRKFQQAYDRRTLEMRKRSVKTNKNDKNDSR